MFNKRLNGSNIIKPISVSNQNQINIILKKNFKILIILQFIIYYLSSSLIDNKRNYAKLIVRDEMTQQYKNQLGLSYNYPTFQQILQPVRQPLECQQSQLQPYKQVYQQQQEPFQIIANRNQSIKQLSCPIFRIIIKTQINKCQQQ
ncbi:hypothetical protein pb186bvf_017988 [Paramecium bursaria]